MVIQCSECQTRFKLADDKMQPEGIKVRCAKCKHVFSVLPPDPVAEDPPAALAPGSSAEASFSGLLDEESSQEFTIGPPDGDEAESTAKGSEEAFAWGEQPEKPVWDDFSISETDDAPAPEVPPATADSTTSDDFDFEATATDAAEAAFDSGSDSREEDFSFEENPLPAGDDFDFGIEDGAAKEEVELAGGLSPDRSESPLAEEEFAFGGAGEGSFDDLLGDDTIGDFSEPEGEPEPPDDFPFAAAPGEPGGKAFEFGVDADTLDFADLDATAPKDTSWDDLETDAFGDEFDLEDDAKTGKSFDFTELSFQEDARVDPLGDEDFGSISLQTPATPEPVGLAPAIATQAGPAETPERSSRPTPPLPTATSPSRGPLSRLVLFVLTLLFALIGAAGYFVWQSGGIAPLVDRLSGTTPTPVVEPQVRLTGLSGSFVNNKDAGQLFVIQGQAINDFPEIRSAITVKGALYDKGGKLLVQQTVFCGNRLDDTALQELPFAKISEAMNNQFGDSLSNLNVAPGKTIPFTIVFRNFPPELAEFTVESVDSRPGSN